MIIFHQKEDLGAFSVCYIDHGFREESVKECAFVRSLAQQDWGVSFHSEKLSLCGNSGISFSGGSAIGGAKAALCLFSVCGEERGFHAFGYGASFRG